MKTKWHISVHPVGGVCLLAALLFVPMERIAVVTITIVAHEAAHLIAIMLCKVKHCSIEWTPLGFVAQADGFSVLPPGKRFFIAGSGLFASLILSILFGALSVYGSFYQELYTANLAILLVNALPILPLDGGRVITALAAGAGCERFAEKSLLILSYLSAIALVGLGLYGAINGILNPMLFFLGPYLAYAAKQCSIAASAEVVQTMESRSHHQQYGVRKVETWAVLGETSPLSIIRVFQQCPQNKFVIFHTINPKDGSISAIETQQQIIEKLTDNKCNNLS